jgi:hypothetical protein
MNQKGLDLQSAIDYVGNLCDQTLVRFNEDRKNLPSWGPDVDRQVATYVDGLASWIIGNVWWLVLFVLFLRLGDSPVRPSSIGVFRQSDIQAWIPGISKQPSGLTCFRYVDSDLGATAGPLNLTLHSNFHSYRTYGKIEHVSLLLGMGLMNTTITNTTMRDFDDNDGTRVHDILPID